MFHAILQGTYTRAFSMFVCVFSCLISCILAPTAISQKTEDLATTYLNRGQWYVIELRDIRQQNTTVTSTVAIMFHEPSHRRVADNYWKFWLTQQKEPHQARAIDLGKLLQPVVIRHLY